MGLIMSGLITMGVAAAVFYAASGNTTTIQIENVSTTGSVAIEALVDRHWNGSSGGCPIDANGDGVSDHLGMSGPPGEAYALTLVDGATGKLLHEGKTYPQSSSAYCLDDRWFVVAQDNFQLDFYDARQPAAPISVAARDKLAKYAMGDRCASFETRDGTTSGVSLPGGTVASCKVTSMRAVHDNPPGLLGLTTKSGQVNVGRRIYELKKRARGTEILTLTVTQGQRSVWSKELPYASSTFATGITIAGDVIVLWAAQPADRGTGVVVGLDEKTGQQLYAKPQNGRTSNNINYIGYNGRYVILAWSVGLFAHDPKTGDVVWQVGKSV
jgi:hypothetical protein